MISAIVEPADARRGRAEEDGATGPHSTACVGARRRGRIRAGSAAPTTAGAGSDALSRSRVPESDAEGGAEAGEEGEKGAHGTTSEEVARRRGRTGAGTAGPNAASAGSDALAGREVSRAERDAEAGAEANARASASETGGADAGGLRTPVQVRKK